MVNSSQTNLPIRIGLANDFQCVRDALREAGFDENTACSVLNITSISELKSVDYEKVDLDSLPARQALFYKLFLFLRLLPREEVEQILEGSTLDSFVKLGLLQSGDFDGEKYYSSILLQPIGDLIIVSDRLSNPDGSAFTAPEDMVFPASFSGTIRFLRLISKSPTREAVDIGTGSGIAALLLSQYVEHVVATDITSRATEFTRFNQLLNRCDNVEIVAGDLYEPLAGRTFDLIVTHPPYMPTLRDAAIWRNGGATGETLVRSVIEGLPTYLNPGGTFYTLTLGQDTKEGLFEERARKWLGASENEFDIIFGMSYETSPKKVILEIALGTPDAQPSDMRKLEQAFEEAQAVKVIYGLLVIHRRTRGVPATKRLKISQDTDGESFEWAIDWLQQSNDPHFFESLSQRKPRISPHLRVTTIYAVQETALLPSALAFEADHPFPTIMGFDDFRAIDLITEFKGESTVAELYEKARSESIIPEHLGLNEFKSLVMLLIERGYLML